MKFVVQVNGHPGSSQAADTAYHFTKAALARNHDILLVFFYFDGVLTGLDLASSASAEAGLACQWSELARQAGFDLVLCVSAAERRGIPAADGSALASGFRIGGLGQWVDACLRGERFIAFAA